MEEDQEIDEGTEKLVTQIKSMVKDEVNAFAHERDLLTARNLLKANVEGFNIDSLSSLKSVGSKQLSTLQDSINSINYDEINVSQINSLNKQIADAIELNTELDKAYKNPKNFIHSQPKEPESGKAADLNEILTNPEAYSRDVVMRSQNGKAVYETQFDDKKYDSSLIGKHNDEESLQYMIDEPLKDFAEMKQRNSRHKGSIKIL